MPNQAYRLRIRNAADTADSLVITSIRGGTNPYIASVPSGDGQEVDLLTGAVRTGAYVVEVVDAVTGTDSIGTIRIITNQLYDGVEEYLLLENGDKILLENGDFIELEPNNAEFGRPHLLSRKAFIEVSTDNGATWPTVWQAGFLSNVTQIDAIRYAFTVSNTRRVEQTKRVFTWSSDAEQSAFPQRGCIIGGPVIGGFGAKPTGGSIALDTGGWEFSFLGSQVVSAFSLYGLKPSTYLSLEFVAGSVAPNYERKTVFSQSEWDILYRNLNPFVQYNAGESQLFGPFTNPIWYGLSARSKVNAYPNLTAIITDASGSEWRGSIASFFSPPDPVTIYLPGLNVTAGGNRLFVALNDAFTDASGSPTVPLPAVGSRLRVRLVSNEVTPQSPLYFDLHPVDIVTKLYDVANISYKTDPTAPYDTGSAQWMKERLGASVRLAARVTEPVIMAEFLEKAIFGPFGFATRTNAAGQQEFFVTRQLGGTISYTIADADIVGDTPPAVWSLDEATAVTGFQINQKQLTQWVQPANTTEIGPADNLVETGQPIQYLNADTTTFSTRIVRYDIPGMVHDVSSFTPTIKELGFAIAYEGFERFGRGAPSSEIAVLGTSAAAAAQVGDLVYLNAGYYPNKNYRIGESTVGARVAQIVRRDERPEGPMFKLVDAGLANQPALGPAITIAASTTNPSRVAQFTLTNAGALDNSGDITVVVEYATGATQPADAGVLFARYTPTNIPTIPVQLPQVIPGSRVWVRARSEQSGLFPSAWTAWTSVTLTAWPVPSSVAVSGIVSGKATLTWSNSGNTADNIDVFLAPGSVAPSDWSPYRLTTVSAGTTTYALVPLTASTAYIAGVAFVDAASNARGTVVTASFSTNTTAMQVASRPAGLAVIPGTDDTGTWATGIQLGIFAAQGETNLVIERADNVPGSPDTPGTFAEVASVPSTQRTWTNYLPADGTKYWYRLVHNTPGKTNSTPTASVSATAQAMPYDVPELAPVSPIVTVTTSESGGTATVTIDVIDPQSRLEQVRFREQTNNGGWSAWTVDSSVPYVYSATIPTTGFVEIEYEVTGYAADGVSRILAAAVEAFDVDTIANIVSATGTFSTAGALTLAVQADSDTNSFKYAVATSPWASDAAAYSAAQAGTLVNARNATITLAGPYASGSSVYVAIAGYTGASGSGTVSGPYRYAFSNGTVNTPSLSVVTTPATADYSLVITWSGTIAYTLDGVSQSVSGWTSPRTVTITRNDYLGASKVAAFSVTRDGITLSESVNVPSKESSGATLTIPPQNADDITDEYTFDWTATGFPTGTQFDLTYTVTASNGDIEQGTDDNATAPVTVVSGLDIDGNTRYQMTVNAIKDGTLILTKSGSGIFAV